jgi:hypothetical protein
VAIADRAYASSKLLDRCRKLKSPITFITRLRLDAALYEAAPPRRCGQRGRPRLKGERVPNLSVVAEAPSTVWKLTRIANWIGSGERMVEVASETAVCYSTGLPAVPLRWVWCAIREASLRPRPSCVPTLTLNRRRSSLGSFGAGRWRCPSKRCGDISDSRRTGSGRIWRYEEPPRRSWDSSRSSRCSPIAG